MQIRYNLNEMKEKTCLLFFGCYQVILGVIMFILLTWWIVYHLFAGNFNLIGFIIAAGVWISVFNLTKISVNDFKKTKESKPSNE
jgi:hypothetical protein